MKKVEVFNQQGKKLKEIELNQDYFDVEIDPKVVQQVLVAQAANSRQVIAHTKNRKEVRGGGTKPWRQKGTGRARHGSIRSPIWAGGGVTFGPTKDRNFKKKINKKMRIKAVKMVLTDKAKEDKIIIIDKIELDQMKTKKIASILSDLKLSKRKVLLVLDKNDDNIIKSARNIAFLKTLPANSLNVYDLLCNEYLCITENGIKLLENIK